MIARTQSAQATMIKNAQRPIVIRRVKKVTGGHHGGAWKVAYADFMTAMMAFFLLLWILSNEDESKLAAMADYFTPNVTPLMNVGGDGVMKGEAVSDSDLITSTDAKVAPEERREAPVEAEASSSEETRAEVASDIDNPWARLVEKPATSLPEGPPGQGVFSALEKRLETVSKAVDVGRKNGNITIEILDLDENPMFASGKAQLTEQNLAIVGEIVQALAQVGGKVIITGHTDAAPYRGDNGYSNWELSADRANAMRRAMLSLGVDPARIVRVSGVADAEPRTPADPLSAENRRVTVELIGAAG